ncbi:MAG TPA: cobalamin biosynthesis protein CobG [Sphingomonas sp.]
MREEAAIRGWCPNAWRPMAAGDGLLMRVRPTLGRMSGREMLALCEASLAYGNGLIDLTNRSGFQLRGVRARDWGRLVAALVDAGLVSADPGVEARALLVVDPAWEQGDDTHRIATELLARASELPVLPAKMGFAVDAGGCPLLGAVPADFRIERDEQGGLMMRLDGRTAGTRIRAGEETSALIRLAHWFVDSEGRASGRAARHHAVLPAWADGEARPAASGDRWRPGEHPFGAIYGLPFGQIDARVLAAVTQRPGASAIRVSPWRMLLVEGVTCDPAEGLVTDPASPLMRIDACPGSPGCPQATVETRAIARRLAPHLGGRRLHVSGCAKGCAHPHPTTIVATGRGGRFDLGFDACAEDAPAGAGLEPDQLLARLGEE